MFSPNIIWLASYPKSGNTWLRAFLTAFFNDGKVDISNLEQGKTWYSNKALTELYLDTCLDDLNLDEIQQLRKLAYIEINKSLEAPLFVKTHDAFNSSLKCQTPIIPEPPSRHIIYIVRNPLDVTLSFSNHKRISCEKIVKQFINNEQGDMGKKNYFLYDIYQFMGTWAQHVKGWLDQKQLPVHLVKYEDMKNNPYETFSTMMKVLGIPSEVDRIQNAIRATSFESLKTQEIEHGFSERPPSNRSFFHKGEAGRGLKELAPGLANEIIKKNRSMMATLGYL